MQPELGGCCAGNSWEPHTQNTGHTSASADGEDRFNSRHQLASRRSTVASGGSCRSDLSRMSVTIQNELHAAEWKIERGALELGRRLGKGGFGESIHHFSSAPCSFEHGSVEGYWLEEQLLPHACVLCMLTACAEMVCPLQ